MRVHFVMLAVASTTALIAVAACVGDEPGSSIGPDAANGDSGGFDRELPDDGASGDGGGGADVDAGPPVVVALAAGGRHSCARRSSGDVLCWGDNGDGQTGQPKGVASCTLFGATTDCTTTATVVPGLTAVEAIATGFQHTCAVTTGREVKCWGRNDFGQLGHVAGTANDEQCVDLTSGSSRVIACNRVPVTVAGLTDVVQVSAAEAHSCARTSSGSVYCWGDNGGKQLGNAAAGVGSAAPVLVSLPAAAIDVATGFAHSSCAVVSSGQVYCWGMNFWGQLGHVGGDVACPAYYNEQCQVTPQPAHIDPSVPDSGLLTGIARVHPGESQTCVLQKTAGGDIAVCWGLAAFGLNGNAAVVAGGIAPTGIDAGGAAKSIAAFRFSQCVVTASGQRSCWGKNNAGELGNGTLSDGDAGFSVRLPTPTGAAGSVVEVAAGHAHMLSRDATGKIHAWGSNVTGQLGHAPGAAGDVDCANDTSVDPSLTKCGPTPVEVVTP